jgi:hypothetical protein
MRRASYPDVEQGAGRRKRAKVHRPVSVFRGRTTELRRATATELRECWGKLGLVAADDRHQISILERLSSHDRREANGRCSNLLGASIWRDHSEELANLVEHLWRDVLGRKIRSATTGPARGQAARSTDDRAQRVLTVGGHPDTLAHATDVADYLVTCHDSARYRARHEEIRRRVCRHR